jgi:hypothetical protein
MSTKNVQLKEREKKDNSNENESIDKENEIKFEYDCIKNEYPQAKLNKPDELKNFDVITHFKENIIHFVKNCSEPIQEYSYYCFTCKHSVCNDCGIFGHKDHILIQRENCLNYDNTFFNEIAKVIEKGINLDTKKDQIKKDIIKSFTHIKGQLDEIEKERLREIDNIFKEIKENYINLKENYLKTKEYIENYYKTNKKFFNIKIYKQKPNKDDIIEIKNNKNNNRFVKTEKNLNTNRDEYTNYYNVNDNELIPNRDIENTIFLMNFELMNLCDNKNLQILDISNNISNKINDITKLIEEDTNSFMDKIKKDFLNFNKNEIIGKFDDFYWDIKLRCEKYTEHVSQFKNTIYDIYKRNGSLEKLKDLLCLFDSKNNKGKDILFNQQFFINMNDLSNLKKDKSTSRKFLSNGKIRSNSKNIIYNTKQKNVNNLTEKNEDNKKQNKTINKTKSNNLINKLNFSNLKNKESDSRFDLKRSPSNNNKFNLFNNNQNNQIPKIENIILNQRIIQRFYSYSILDYYSKYFKVNINNVNDSDEENNIYSNKNNYRYNSAKHINKNNNRTNNNKILFSDYKLNIPKNMKNIENINLSSGNLNNDNIKNVKSKYKSNFKSVSLLSNYSERYMELKEKVKPIPNTNYIQLFDPKTTRMSKIKVPLTKEEHGYATFPDGCRHLLIESDLYITGGTDNCGYPINIVLTYNIDLGELTRITNLNDNHSYHSIEYLENFDSIIVVGGENSSSCEIMDLDSKKWTKLPSLNYPRANSNIYYNNVTSDLFVLFGMEGEMTEKTKNTDVIEVLELNDIIGGWMMVDYYKSVGLDLKSNYCITLPFTRDKLLVYGGSSARSIEKRLFAIFDMIKNECIKVDSATMDLIKQEESKIRAFDNALEKIS